MTQIEFNKIKDDLMMDGAVLQKTTCIGETLMNQGINYPYVCSTITEDAIHSNNGKNIWLVLNKFAKRLSLKLDNDVQSDEDRFTMHFGFNMTAVGGGETHKYIPFTLGLTDGQVLTALVRNQDERGKFNPAKKVVVTKWILNNKDITPLVYKNGDTSIDMATTVLRLKSMIEGVHKRFISKNPTTAKTNQALINEINAMTIDLSDNKVVFVKSKNDYTDEGMKDGRITLAEAMKRIDKTLGDASFGLPVPLNDGTVIMKHLTGETVESVNSKGLYLYGGKIGAMKPLKSLSFEEAKRLVEDSYSDKIQTQNEAYNEEVLSLFISEAQLKAMKSNELKDVKAEIIKTIETMPKTYETDDQGDNAIAYLHYFKNGSDWYITERDQEDEQEQAFGYTILNGDTKTAELGYISIEELKSIGAELDLYYTPQTLKEIKGKTNKGNALTPYEQYIDDLESGEITEEEVKDIINEATMDMTKEQVQALSDEEFENRGDLLTDQNYHSEKVLFDAKRTGNDDFIKEANDIIEQHNEEGSLSKELGERRKKLSLKIKATLLGAYEPEKHKQVDNKYDMALAKILSTPKENIADVLDDIQMVEDAYSENPDDEILGGIYEQIEDYLNTMDSAIYDKVELDSIDRAICYLDGTNILFYKVSRDINGNKTIVIGFPNQKAFSIQTNGNLPKANKLQRHPQLNEIQSIREEVVEYIKEYGSQKQKSSLKIFKEDSVSEDALYFQNIQDEYPKNKVREFGNYKNWVKAVKQIDHNADFTGDEDIDGAFKKGEVVVEDRVVVGDDEINLWVNTKKLTELERTIFFNYYEVKKQIENTKAKFMTAETYGRGDSVYTKFIFQNKEDKYTGQYYKTYSIEEAREALKNVSNAIAQAKINIRSKQNRFSETTKHLPLDKDKAKKALNRHNDRVIADDTDNTPSLFKE